MPSSKARRSRPRSAWATRRRCARRWCSTNGPWRSTRPSSRPGLSSPAPGRACTPTASTDPALGAAARAAAERALALAPDRAEGRLALGNYYTDVLQDNDKAVEQFELGRKIDPRNADLLAGIAIAEQSRGHYDLVVRDLTEALAMDPRSVQTTRRLSRALLWLRRYPEALAEPTGESSCRRPTSTCSRPRRWCISPRAIWRGGGRS